MQLNSVQMQSGGQSLNKFNDFTLKVVYNENKLRELRVAEWLHKIPNSSGVKLYHIGLLYFFGSDTTLQDGPKIPNRQ